MAEGIEKKLEKWFAGAKKVVLAGIGNPIRTDDYVGLKIVEKLRRQIARKLFFCWRLKRFQKATSST